MDCDVHPNVGGIGDLFPYMEELWQETIKQRSIESLDTIAYPVNAPITSRHDWRGKGGRAGTNIEELTHQVFDGWGSTVAVCNCLYGVQLLFNPDMGAVAARALNMWMAKEWLDRDVRLRSSIVISLQDIDKAVDEINRCATDSRFVQILVLAMGEMPLGRRHYWPLYAAAERHSLPIAIHAGSSYRQPVTSLGWPNYYLEDYLSQSQGFQTQVASLICEGVFVKYPKLKVILAESGVSWAPGFLWRLGKFWRGVRTEVPWLDRPPIEIFRDHFFMTTQPLDAPDTPETIGRLIDHLGSDSGLLFSSDYPHWQFDGDNVLPPGIDETLELKIRRDNPLSAYPRISAGAA